MHTYGKWWYDALCMHVCHEQASASRTARAPPWPLHYAKLLGVVSSLLGQVTMAEPLPGSFPSPLSRSKSRNNRSLLQASPHRLPTSVRGGRKKRPQMTRRRKSASSARRARTPRHLTTSSAEACGRPAQPPFPNTTFWLVAQLPRAPNAATVDTLRGGLPSSSSSFSAAIYSFYSSRRVGSIQDAARHCRHVFEHRVVTDHDRGITIDRDPLLQRLDGLSPYVAQRDAARQCRHVFEDRVVLDPELLLQILDGLARCVAQRACQIHLCVCVCVCVCARVRAHME
jgi:hypothetical protein